MIRYSFSLFFIKLSQSMHIAVLQLLSARCMECSLCVNSNVNYSKPFHFSAAIVRNNKRDYFIFNVCPNRCYFCMHFFFFLHPHKNKSVGWMVVNVNFFYGWNENREQTATSFKHHQQPRHHHHTTHLQNSSLSFSILSITLLRVE